MAREKRCSNFGNNGEKKVQDTRSGRCGYPGYLCRLSSTTSSYSVPGNRRRVVSTIVVRRCHIAEAPGRTKDRESRDHQMVRSCSSGRPGQTSFRQCQCHDRKPISFVHLTKKHKLSVQSIRPGESRGGGAPQIGCRPDDGAEMALAFSPGAC